MSLCLPDEKFYLEFLNNKTNAIHSAGCCFYNDRHLFKLSVALLRLLNDWTVLVFV